MQEIKIINDYKIKFSTDYGRFELFEHDASPKMDKYWKEMIDSGSQGHEYPRPPEYEYHYYSSNEEKCLWYQYLKDTIVFIKKFTNDNKLSLVKNSKYEELRLQIETNKNWYIKYERTKKVQKQKQAKKEVNSNAFYERPAY